MAENYYPATYRNASGNALAFSTTADRVFDGTTSVAAEISALQTGKATAAQGAKADALAAGGGVSLSEIDTGVKDYDGSEIYSKTITIDAFPAAGVLSTYSLGLAYAYVKRLVRFDVLATNGTYWYPLPYASANNYWAQVDVRNESSKPWYLYAYTGSSLNLSTFHGWATTYYTKA